MAIGFFSLKPEAQDKAHLDTNAVQKNNAHLVLPSKVFKDSGYLKNTTKIPNNADTMPFSDSLDIPVPKNNKIYKPVYYSCSEPTETVLGCFREVDNLAIMETGFPGFKSKMLHMATFLPVMYKSLYNPSAVFSPHNSAGLNLPKQAKLQIENQQPILSESWTHPEKLDSPLTVINWERGAFGMNLFDLHFGRMLSDNAYFIMDVASSRADSGVYEYVFQVHQPFLSDGVGMGKYLTFLERDSASLVVKGNFPKIETFSIRPRFGIYLEPQTLVEVYWESFTNNSDRVSPRCDSVAEPYESYREAVQTLLPASFKSSSLGSALRIDKKQVSANLRFASSSFEKEEQMVLPVLLDSLSKQADTTSFYQGHILDFNGNIGLPSVFSHPELGFTYRNEKIKGDLFFSKVTIDSMGVHGIPIDEGWSDHQSLFVSASPSVSVFKSRLKTGVERMSLMHNEFYYLGFYSIDIHAPLIGGLSWELHNSLGHWQPDWNSMYVMNSVTSRFPAPDISPETLLWLQNELSYNYRELALGLSWNNTSLYDAILPQRLPFKGDSMRTDDSALSLVNYETEKRNILGLNVSYKLFNWKLRVEYSHLFHSQLTGKSLDGQSGKINPLLPSTVTKGTLSWGRRFVQDRLRVQIGWQWEWYSHRYQWVPQLNGVSRVEKMDEFIALDFHAHMQIKTFILYYQIKNFNHDRYSIEPGSHPPGINFRYGVHWVFSG
ncbi:MAG: hypothetical protein HQK83_06640 [Fibrobacteria bacterium]|nr:hypothetical protein [Fibrobacteria bacterium]